jgi:hypothetical protein
MDQISRALLAVGGGVTEQIYIEDVFSTYLYSGSPSNNTITNGIDLAGKGGLVWMKSRTDYTTSGYSHALYDTERGNLSRLLSNTAEAASTGAGGTYMQSFNSNGFTLVGNGFLENYSTQMVSWAFREQPKFFDVVTYTGNGSNRTIAHSLGSVPGCIIVKRTDTNADWQVYHRSNANTEYMVLNSSAAKATGATRWNSTTPTSTVFSIGTDTTVNASGGTYVAYLFAHNAGGFGASGTDNVISCGSFTGANPATINLGYEPQWLLIKSSTNADNWYMFDTMRGWTANYSGLNYLIANSSGAENLNGNTSTVTSTGFTFSYGVGETFIYIAIRRGPMRTPTTGTSVYLPTTDSNSGGTSTTTNFVVDMNFVWSNDFNNVTFALADRLRGFSAFSASSPDGAPLLATNRTDAESLGYTPLWYSLWNKTVLKGNGYSGTSSTTSFFSRAPGFFDVVCYTGTGSATTFNHNLGVVPEMIIVKRRSATDDWWVYDAATGNTKYQVLNSTATPTTSSTAWNNTMPTSSVFSVGTGTPVNASAGTYVAYFFATVAGVSKVGSYTGNGSNQTINCGFTTGARFVLIKRTDTTGDWWYFNSAQGISSGNDPYILLNSTAKAVTGTNYVDTASTGFQVTAAAPAGMNANGGSYIFLAIA